MKNFLIALCAFVACCSFNNLYGYHNNYYNNNVMYDNDANCNVDPCAEYPCGPCVCYCPVTRYRQQNYCVTKCVEEPYTVEKKCCRYVDQYYNVCRCRYVPEYYTKTYCRQVPQYYEETCCRKCPEYYTTCETRYCKKYVKEQRCRWVPYTCVVRKECAAPGCPVNGQWQGAPQQQYTAQPANNLNNGQISQEKPLQKQAR